MPFKECCIREKYLFNHEEPHTLIQGRWTTEERVSKPYLAFKVVVSIYLIMAYILSHLQFYWKPYFNKCNEENDSKQNFTEKYLSEKKHLCDLDSVWPYYWLYFTTWSFSIFTICVILDTSLVAYRYINTNQKYDWNKNILKISWALTTIAYPIAFTVTVIYWAALHNYKKPITALEFYLEFNVHAVQSLIAFSDIMVSAKPWRLNHFYVPFLYGMFYGLFQVLYVVGAGASDEKGHDYIYRILRWNTSPAQAVGVICAIGVLGLFFHLLICLIAYGRDLLWKKLEKKS